MLEGLRHDAIRCSGSIQHPETFRPARGTGKKTFAYALMKGQSLCLKTAFALGEALAAIASQGAAKTYLGRKIKKEGNVRPERIRSVVVEPLELFHVHTAPIALVRDGGVGIAVAYDPLTTLKSRTDGIGYMLGSVCQKKKQFGPRVHLLPGIQQQGAYLPSKGTAPRLSGMQKRNTTFRQFIFKQTDERTFACAFHAFYSKEHCLSSILSFFFSALLLRWLSPTTVAAGDGVRTGRQSVRPIRLCQGPQAISPSFSGRGTLRH